MKAPNHTFIILSFLVLVLGGLRAEEEPVQVDKLSVQEIMELLDLDGNGAITQAEINLSPGMKFVSDEARKKIFKRLDKNGDGAIIGMEIAVVRRERKIGGERNKGALNFGDKNQDGKITWEEFETIPFVAAYPPKRRDRLFRRLDLNRNGVLDREDNPATKAGFYRPIPMIFLKRLDADQSKDLSFEEYLTDTRIAAKPKAEQERIFSLIDRDHNGRLSNLELRVARGADLTKPKKPRRPEKPDPEEIEDDTPEKKTEGEQEVQKKDQ